MNGSVFEETNRVFESAGQAYEYPDPGYEAERGGVEPLSAVSSDMLTTMCFPRQRFLVDTFLGSGLCVLAGAPKLGKSWLVLLLCMQLAKGEPFLGLNTEQGDVLYVAMEDDLRRLQKRVFTITDESSPHLYLVTRCSPLGGQLSDQLRAFKEEHPDLKLVVLDTFQKIRSQVKEMSYANDYAEASTLKRLADELDICILLVHHTRKQGDADYMNEISGTNGIAGCADTLMVLKKEKRSSRDATLSCTGRDIEDREMTLRLDRETCVWELKSDSLTRSEDPLPEELTELIEYVKKIGSFHGTNAEFTAGFMDERSYIITPSILKRSMNRYRYELEDRGVVFTSTKWQGKRMLSVVYNPKEDRDLAEGNKTGTPTRPARWGEEEPPHEHESSHT